MREASSIKILILDGYNVIHKLGKISGTDDTPLRSRRNALITFLRRWKEKKSFTGKIIIVFDGRDGVFGGDGQSVYGIDCFFTPSREEADERIVSILKKISNVSGIVVISEDNYVSNHCRAFGVDVVPATFLLNAFQSSARPLPSKESPEKKIDPATRQAIDQQMKKEWGIE